jgi:hypothetical protein
VHTQTDPVVKARGKVGPLVRDGAPPEVIEEARHDLREALLAKRIRELADAMPPLSEERRARLAQLLAPAVS